MKKLLSWTFLISGIIFAISFLCFIGAEPDTFTEDNLESFARFYDKGETGWYIGWITLYSFVIFIFSVLGLNFIYKNERK